jgi:prohibitin 2
MSRRGFREPPTITIDPQPLMVTAGVALIVFALVVLIGAGTYVVQPGNRGIEVRLGSVTENFKPEGLGFKMPFIASIHNVSVRQRTRTMPAEGYSSDLQQVRMELQVLYRIPEQSVVTIFRDYQGEAFDTLIAPRVQEALKEVAASRSAELIVKQRREVKLKALELAQRKVGTNLIEIVDLVLFDIRLSPELEQAIEMKMVQEQEAEKANFTQLKTQIEADTAVIRARGEGEGIAIRGQALVANPDFIKLQVVETWNGRSPLVVGAAGGSGLLINPTTLPQHVQPAPGRTTPTRLPPTRSP